MRRQITMFLGRVDLLHVSFNRIRLKDKNIAADQSVTATFARLIRRAAL
jgi:hypothetical protein